MTERGHFIYQSEDGTVMVSFERAGGGVPIECLLPASGRGDCFGEFRVVDYLNLADLVLAERNEFAAFCRSIDTTGATKANPKMVHPPAPNMDYLRLRRGEGLDQPRTEELFSVVAAYWEAKPNTMALEPGLVGALWYGGMSAKEIIKYIRLFTGPDGKIDKPAGRGPDIMNTASAIYRKIHGMTDACIMNKAHAETLLTRWLTATRSVACDSPEAQNEALHWADYRELGLVDKAGNPDLERARALAEQIFRAEDAMTFADAIAWADRQKRADGSLGNPNRAARAQLKKKRKLGRVSRKRGSR